MSLQHTANHNEPNQAQWEFDRLPGNYLIHSQTCINWFAAFLKLVDTFNLRYQQVNISTFYAYNDAMWVVQNSETITIIVLDSCFREVQEVLKAFPKPERAAFIKWWYNTDRGPSSQSMPLEGRSPEDAFYPWLPKSIAELAKEFSESDANVLLLIGPPGTGKTSFIRGLIRAMNYETWLTYDAGVQECEPFYVSFAGLDGGGNLIPKEPSNSLITKWAGSNYEAAVDGVVIQGTYGIAINYDTGSTSRGGRMLVMEDADHMLGKRTDGNKIMNRLLNLSDGLVTLPKRKIIFSTNLPGLRDVDEAILRPGRCFAVVQFRSLNKAEQIAAAASIGRTPKVNADKATLSQVLNGDIENTLSVQKIGF